MQHDMPSCMDYPIMHCNVTAQVVATWQAAPADHAWVQVTIDVPTQTPDATLTKTLRRMPIWRPTSYEDARKYMYERRPYNGSASMGRHPTHAHTASGAMARDEQRKATKRRPRPNTSQTFLQARRRRQEPRRHQTVQGHGMGHYQTALQNHHRQRHGQRTTGRSNDRQNKSPQDHKSPQNHDKTSPTTTTPRIPSTPCADGRRGTPSHHADAG